MKTTTAIVVLILMTGLAVADPQPGAVMATDISGNPDADLYPGTAIYIVGHHLVAGSSFSWEIYDMEDAGCSPIPPGGIGCGTLVNSGDGGVVNSDRTISPPHPTGWTLPDPDYGGHKYKLIVTIGPNPISYAEFYTKVDSFAPVPEIATAALVGTGLLGLVLVSRRQKY